MARIIVAFPEKETLRRVQEALESGGYDVFRTCMTGNEVMRAFNLCQDGILISGVRFPDRTADALAWDLNGQALILVVGRTAQLEYLEHPDLFRRPFPCSRAELIAAVDLLIQLHDHRMPRRGADQAEAIVRAKRLLIRESGFSEPEAHRALQRYSMAHGLRMEECARRLISRELTAEALNQ